MPVVRQTLDVSAINAQLHGPSSGVMRDMLRRGLRVQAAARRRAPADTGRLRTSIEVGTEPRVVAGFQTMAVIVGSNLDYAPMVHNGTGIYGPHGAPITPRTGQYLVFKGKGKRLVFVKSVRGQRGVPFLKDALKSARG